MKKIYCLYRGKNQKEIRKQEDECRLYAVSRGWKIEREFYECEQSNNEQRDAITIIHDKALNKKFDTLLLYEYDSIGREACETPFAVQFFRNKHIDVISVKPEKRDFKRECDEIKCIIKEWKNNQIKFT